MIARAAGGLVVLCGVYLILRVSGLTQLALTLVGGTGLIGLILGIAFRDITENFLSSIFLSIQRPFETGDLVEISGVTGYVQQLNMRTTILMTLDGYLAQIPNATVYKTIVSNFSTSPNRRADFVVGIGYGDAIAEAQEIARKVLADHPAVLNDPEPSVLADSLGSATVEVARLLLAQRARAQLAEGALLGHPAGEARLSGPGRLDARRGPRGGLPARHPRHLARPDTDGRARERAWTTAPRRSAGRGDRRRVDKSRSGFVQRIDRHRGAGTGGKTLEGRGKPLAGGVRHGGFREARERNKAIGSRVKGS